LIESDCQMSEQIDRLNRIEEKLDKVSEAIVSLARMEERMIGLFKRMDTYDAQQSLLNKRVTNLEVSHANVSGSNRWVDKVIVVIITGAITFVFFASK